MLEAFASFGFCKAHAAAFALPTYQSAWLKTHWPAHFLAGVLTHDPGMYPKRLILDDARQLGVGVLGLDVNASDARLPVERGRRSRADADRRADDPPRPARGYGIRLSLADVKGISAAEVARIVGAPRPYASLTDFWHRARVSRPVVERLVLAGGFDSRLRHRARARAAVRRRGRVTRRDLLLQVAELDRYARAVDRARGRGAARRAACGPRRPRPRAAARQRARNSTDPAVGTRRSRPSGASRPARGPGAAGAVAARPARSAAAESVQLTLDLGDAPGRARRAARAGLPEMSTARAGAGRARDPRPRRQPACRRRLRPLPRRPGRRPAAATCCDRRSRAELLVAGVKVATQTPRSAPDAGWCS